MLSAVKYLMQPRGGMIKTNVIYGNHSSIPHLQYACGESEGDDASMVFLDEY